jgi:PAS domain S-box-containing protein
MNTLVSVAVDSVPCVAVAPSAQGATCPSKSARHQAALLALGRMQLSGLNSVEIAQEFVPVIARALGTSICGLIEVVPDAAPSAIEQIICEPESALRSGPRPGATTDDDGFLAILLEKSVRLLVADVQTDGRFHKTWCHRQGVRSAIGIPLLLHNQRLGALVVGHAEAGFYDEEDLLFLELIGGLLTAHISRAKAEATVRIEREYSAALLDGITALTVVLTSKGEISSVNRTCLELTGQKRHQLVQQPFWSSLCVPTEARLAEASFGQLNADVAAIEFESALLDADGDRRFISWRLCYLANPERVPVIVATGVDMTKQREAEQNARQAISAAEAAKKLVEELRAVQSRGGDSPAAAGAEAMRNRSPEKTGAEKRTSQRKLFPYRQLVAPYEAGVIPPRDQFKPIRCWDISAGGISFLFDEQPEFRSLVVVLGGASGEVLMSAEIVRLTELDEDENRGFLAGCRFTGKL